MNTNFGVNNFVQNIEKNNNFLASQSTPVPTPTPVPAPTSVPAPTPVPTPTSVPQLDLNILQSKILEQTKIISELQLQVNQLNSDLIYYKDFYNKFANNHKRGRRPSKKLKGKLEEIKLLKASGHSNREIANLYGVTETTIRRYLKK